MEEQQHVSKSAQVISKISLDGEIDSDPLNQIRRLRDPPKCLVKSKFYIGTETREMVNCSPRDEVEEGNSSSAEESESESVSASSFSSMISYKHPPGE